MTAQHLAPEQFSPPRVTYGLETRDRSMDKGARRWRNSRSASTDRLESG